LGIQMHDASPIVAKPADGPSTMRLGMMFAAR